MYGQEPISRQRAGAIVAVAAIHLALGYALITGLSVDLTHKVADTLATFSVLPPPPPPPEPPKPKPKPLAARAPRKEGAAAPANLTAKATELVAPPVVIPPPVPPPVVVAPTASTGADNHSGNAPVPGPGTGSGGRGEGSGSGQSGDGPGGGGGGGTDAELVSRGIQDSDFPRGMPDDGRAHRVRTRITIGTDGRVGDCAVVNASDSQRLDTAICGVLRKRLRFRPARDAAGRAVTDYAYWEHVWSSGSYDPGED
jgi:protein TonB